MTDRNEPHDKPIVSLVDTHLMAQSCRWPVLAVAASAHAKQKLKCIDPDMQSLVEPNHREFRPDYDHLRPCTVDLARLLS